MESISNQPTPQGSGATTPDNPSAADTLSEQDEGTMTPPSKQTTPATSPHNSFRYDCQLLLLFSVLWLVTGWWPFSIIKTNKRDCGLFPQNSWFRFTQGRGASAGAAEEDPGGAGRSGLWRKHLWRLRRESGWRQPSQESRWPAAWGLATGGTCSV